MGQPEDAEVALWEGALEHDARDATDRGDFVEKLAEALEAQDRANRWGL